MCIYKKKSGPQWDYHIHLQKSTVSQNDGINKFVQWFSVSFLVAVYVRFNAVFFLPPPFILDDLFFFCLSFIRHVHIECSTHFKLYVVERIARLNPITSCVHCVWFYCVCICAARERSWIYCAITFISIFSQFQPKICSLILLFGHSMCIFFLFYFDFFGIYLIRITIWFTVLVSKVSCCYCCCCPSTLQTLNIFHVLWRFYFVITSKFR